jgi:predicted lipoprotein with Yx(FWY)xxD motif
VRGVLRQFAGRRTVTAGLTLVLAAAGVAGTTMAANASSANGKHSAEVVKVKTHRPFGKILYTTHNQALYYLPKGAGSCRGSCLSVWPTLLMPVGKTEPEGAKCLGTVAFGKRRQVTFNHRRLYTFVSDSRGSVTGNNVEGFKVAKVAAHCH